MLEIFGIMMLCKANKKNALARGRRPGGFIALTIILWVGLELVGFVIGAMTEIEYGYFLFGYGFAGIGALISFLCAKFGPKGNYVDPKSVPENPAAGIPVSIDGQLLGTYNVPVDPSTYAPYQNAAPVQQTQFQNGAPVQQAPFQAAPVQQAQAVTQPKFCGHCGSPLQPGNNFCDNCGAKI